MSLSGNIGHLTRLTYSNENCTRLASAPLLWSSIGWGIGLIMHGINVFEVINRRRQTRYVADLNDPTAAT